MKYRSSDGDYFLNLKVQVICFHFVMAYNSLLYSKAVGINSILQFLLYFVKDTRSKIFSKSFYSDTLDKDRCY